MEMERGSDVRSKAVPRLVPGDAGLAESSEQVIHAAKTQETRDCRDSGDRRRVRRPPPRLQFHSPLP